MKAAQRQPMALTEFKGNTRQLSLTPLSNCATCITVDFLKSSELKVKVKVSHIHAMQAQREKGRTVPLILNLGISCR
jgi:hypothetical protein